MQSGYGGVSEMQQFLVDGCASTLFSIPPPPPGQLGNPPTDIHSPAPHLHPHHHPSLLPQFPHFHPMPITQQLFQQTHHQFQLFHQPHQPEQRRMVPHLQHHHVHQQLGLDQDSGPENSSSPSRLIAASGGGGGHPHPSFLSAAMNFKLAVNDSSGGGCSRDGLNDDDAILQGDDGSESRFHPWQREEESAIKEPFWRPLDIDYINGRDGSKRYKEKETETSANTYSKKSKDGNYKVFSELDAIYKPGGSGKANNQTRSGSALTGDENPFVTAGTAPNPAIEQQAAEAADHQSDTSTGGAEVPPSKSHKVSGGRRKRKWRQQHQLNSIAAFFEKLVKQLMEHQESLHHKFLEVMERRDQERTIREETWRRQEAAKASREAAAKAEERALAATREAAIIAFLERITGESLNLPTKSEFQSKFINQAEDTNADNNSINPIDTFDAFNIINNNITDHTNVNRAVLQLNTSRWPRAEVQALIRVRGGLETRFQEPGLKGPLWEEVSTIMASIGYERSAKRCKEKWENINKYFRKTKDSGKKRPQHSKTCPYFHQLDQLYSSKLALPPTTSDKNFKGRDNSELLDAIIVSTSGPPMIDYKGKECVNSEHPVKAKDDEVDMDRDGDGDDHADDEELEEGEGEGEGEGESQGQWQAQQQFHSLHTSTING